MHSCVEVYTDDVNAEVQEKKRRGWGQSQPEAEAMKTKLDAQEIHMDNREEHNAEESMNSKRRFTFKNKSGEDQIDAES